MLRSQRVGQPARAAEEPLGLRGHVAPPEDARLGDTAEVVADRRSPTGLNHVEADGVGETVSLRDALLYTMRRDAWTTVAVALLVKGIHAERHAVRQQRG